MVTMSLISNNHNGKLLLDKPRIGGGKTNGSGSIILPYISKIVPPHINESIFQIMRLIAGDFLHRSIS